MDGRGKFGSISAFLQPLHQGKSALLLPFYIIALSLSSGMTGVFVRRALAAQGFVPTYETGLLSAGGVALAFAAAQVAGFAVLRFLKPTRDNAPYLSEICSFGAVAVLLPYLLGVEIPWPKEILKKLEPLIYLAAFGGIHVFFKLVTLYAFTVSRPAGRLAAAWWLGAYVILAGFSFGLLTQWRGALDAARVSTPGEAMDFASGSMHALARRNAEGAIYKYDFPAVSGRTLSLRFANPPNSESPLDSAHVRIEIGGDFGATQPVKDKNGEVREVPAGSAVIMRTIELRPDGWAEIVFPAEDLPEAATHLSLVWNAEEAPAWAEYTGLRPVGISGRELLVAGPFVNDGPATPKAPNILLLAVEGLGAENVHQFGYTRETTPSLDILAREGFACPYAYSPAPEAAAACMTLLTGLTPLAHGYLGKNRGLLPEKVDTLAAAFGRLGYVSAAFTEGQGEDDKDLFYGSGFERGFDLFDDCYPVEDDASATPEAPKGVAVTLDKVSNWMEAHRNTRFFVFVRLRELRIPMPLPRYGEGYIGKGRTPDPVDVYDTALKSVDAQIGAFVSRLRDMPELQHTAIAIASPYGFDFSEADRGSWRRGGEPKRLLSEASLRVPVLLSGPGIASRNFTKLVALEDLPVTLLMLAGGKFNHNAAGFNILQHPGLSKVISMDGDPLAMSLRNPIWRFTWQSGKAPFTGVRESQEQILEFISIQDYQGKKARRDFLTEQSARVEEYRGQLMEYCDHWTAL